MPVEESPRPISPKITPKKSVVLNPTSNMFTKPRNNNIEPSSIRSSAQDSVAHTLKGSSRKGNNVNATNNLSYSNNKQSDFFDQRAKPVAPTHKRPQNYDVIEINQESSDYDEDFEADQNQDINEVADNILKNVKPRSTKAKDASKNEKSSIFYPTTSLKKNSTAKKDELPMSKITSPPAKIQKSGNAKFISGRSQPRPTKKFAPPKQEEPKLKKKPALPTNYLNRKNNSQLRTSQESVVAPVGLKLLDDENENIIKQIHELTKQIDLRMLNFKRRANHTHMTSNNSVSNDRLKSNTELMQEKARQLRTLKKDTAEMYKILEKTYKVDEITKKENKIKNQQKIISKQLLTLKDCKKDIRRQNRFFKDAERINEQTGRPEEIEQHYSDAKLRIRELKEELKANSNPTTHWRNSNVTWMNH